MYHRVCPKQNSWSLLPLAPFIFEQQMEYYTHNYEILTLECLVQIIRERKRLPQKAVVITFDDGYKDNYLYAYPVLKKYNVPATIFLTTGHIGNRNLLWTDTVRYIIRQTSLKTISPDNLGKFSLKTDHYINRACYIICEKMKRLPDDKRMSLIMQMFSVCGVDMPENLGKNHFLSWDEVKEMNDNGIEFGAHTVNHPILTTMPLEQAMKEIIQSKKDIEQILSKQITAFAYPNGNYNSQLVEIVKACGFSCAVSVKPGKLIGQKSNLFGLSRISATNDSSKMKVMTCGLWGDLYIFQ